MPQSFDKQDLGSEVIKANSLVQFWRKQSFVCIPLPGQSLPSGEGAGLLQKRSRLVMPTPQGSLQADQALQDDHDPSTRAVKEVDNLRYYLNHLVFEKTKIFTSVVRNSIDKSCLRSLGLDLREVK